ncbi:unnamed protein product [Phyllotreta striolata]|uniref:Cytochrome P450 n=1 Tax=Phyllotreta striolata TaxID=444603 RepID=A0A9N9TZ72_PHYSR|nr:unnamed protein product [Phyllotreta striolata]
MLDFVFSIICASLIYLFLKDRYRVNKNWQQLNKWLPTRAGWPIIGNALEFKDLPDVLAKLPQMIPKDKKVLLLYIVGSADIFVTDKEFVDFILSNQDILYKSIDYKFYSKWLGKGLITGGGQEWRSRRRIINPSFNYSILENFLEIFDSNGKVLIEKLKQISTKEKINIHHVITLYTLDVICEAAMGVKVNAQQDSDSAYVRNVNFLCQIGMTRAVSVVKNFDLLYPLTLDFYRELRAVKHLRDVTDSVIKERSRWISNDDGEITDDCGRKKKMAFLDHLLKARIDGKPLPQEWIREEVNTFMFAGHDTSASAISFCLYFLSENPEIQKRVVEEQQSIFSDDIYRSSTLNDLNMMKYLECVIKETLRLCPSVPIYGRYADKDINYKGNVIPKGTNIVLFPFGMHRDEDYYPDPEKFDPSRFENPDEKRPYISFSAGPRNCIGQKFAWLEMKTIISKIIRNFELLPTNPRHKLVYSAETVLKSITGVDIGLKIRKW